MTNKIDAAEALGTMSPAAAVEIVRRLRSRLFVQGARRRQEVIALNTLVARLLEAESLLAVYGEHLDRVSEKLGGIVANAAAKASAPISPSVDEEEISLSGLYDPDGPRTIVDGKLVTCDRCRGETNMEMGASAVLCHTCGYAGPPRLVEVG